MTQEHEYHASGVLGVAIGLAAVAGFVDAHVFLHVAEVFVANMSGNLIHLGMSTGLEDWQRAARSAVSLVAFAGGIVVATVLHQRHVRAGRRPRPVLLLIAESVLLIALVGLLVAVPDLGEHVDRGTDPGAYVAVLLGATAMGLQTVALRRVGSVAVATTYGTGTIVRIGEKLALGARGAERTSEVRRRVTVVVLVSVLAGYVGGAILATVMGSSPANLLVPIAALGVCAAVSARWTGDDG